MNTSVLWSRCFPLLTILSFFHTWPNPVHLATSLQVPPLLWCFSWTPSLSSSQMFRMFVSKKPQKQQQKLKTSFVEPHRDGHYFLKEITFLHQKAGGIWCQFNDSFKKWIKYIYMERTLYCPFSPHLILLVTDKSLIADCSQSWTHGLMPKWGLQPANPQHFVLLILWHLVMFDCLPLQMFCLLD